MLSVFDYFFQLGFFSMKLAKASLYARPRAVKLYHAILDGMCLRPKKVDQ